MERILTWKVILPLAGFFAALPYFLSTTGTGVVVAFTTLVMTSAAVWAFFNRRMPTRVPMGSMAVAGSALFVENIDWLVRGGGVGPVGSTAGAIASLAFMVGCLAILNARRPGLFRDGLLDATATLIAVGAMEWQWSGSLSSPGLVHAIKTMLSATVILIFAGLFAIMWRLVFDKAQNKAIIWSIIVANITSFLSAFATESWARPEPLWPYSISVIAGWLLAGVYVHPDAPRMFEPEPMHERRLNLLRWLGPTSALVVSPAIMAVLVLRSEAPSMPVALASVLLTGVVIMRIGRLLREREEGRKQLAVREQRFRSLVEHAADIIAITDERGIITYLSGDIKELLGVEASQLLGRSVSEMVADEHRAGVAKALTRQPTAEGMPVQSHDVKLKRPDHQLRWVSVRITDHLETPSVNGWVLNVHDNTDRKQAEEALSRMALYDPLTGLSNRAHMRDRLELLVTQSPGTTGLLFCDLDGFKAVNDVLGHEAGDEVLAAIAGRWSSLLRAGDLLGRWGGDEFLVICPDMPSINPVEDLADRLLGALASTITVSKGEAQLGCSIGLTVHQRGESVDELVSRADAAMYGAKRVKAGVQVA